MLPRSFGSFRLFSSGMFYLQSQISTRLSLRAPNILQSQRNHPDNEAVFLFEKYVYDRDANNAPIAQGIEPWTSKPLIQVRVLVGAPK